MPVYRIPLISYASKAAGSGAFILAYLLFAPGSSAGDRDHRSLLQTAESRPSTTVRSSGGWLDSLNHYRATAGLPPVTENTAWSRGDRDHAVYIVKNEVLQHSEDPDSDWYTPEGQTAAHQSNLFNSDQLDDTDSCILDTWMQSPFHAVGVLDPRLVQVGFGSYREADGDLQTGAALNVLAGLDQTVKASYPVFWPCEGATVPINFHWGGYPNPLTGCPGYSVPSGLPLIIQIGPGNLTPVVSASSFTHDGRPLEHCVFDETTYNNPDRTQQKLGRSILGARNAIVLIPRSPLAAGATYTASITVNGQTHTWTFSTSSTALARESHSFPE